MKRLANEKTLVLLAGLMILAIGEAAISTPARAIFASPIQAGCYVVAPGECRLHAEPFTLNLTSGKKLVFFQLVAVTQGSGLQNVVYHFRPDQSNPVPLSGSTYTPSLVKKDFAATCGNSYELSLQGQDTGDATAYNLGITGVIACPQGTGIVWMPMATTDSATGMTMSGALLNGTVNPQGGNTTVTFEYGATTAYGSVATPSPDQFTGTAPSSVGAAVNGLNPGSTYHFRLVATNSAGTSRGADHQFSTEPLPTVTLTAPVPLASESGKRGKFLIARTGDTSLPLVVRYTLSGKAKNGVDYTLLSGKATILAGYSSKAIRLIPINDSIREGPESVRMTLKAKPRYLIGTPSSAKVTIEDND